MLAYPLIFVPGIGHNLNQSNCLAWFTACLINETLTRYNNSHKNLFSLIKPSRKIKQMLNFNTLQCSKQNPLIPFLQSSLLILY